MASEEHFMCVGGAWDPTGRYFASWVDSRHQMENGYEIRSFNGKLLYRESLDAFAQFQWRPRPPSLLVTTTHARPMHQYCAASMPAAACGCPLVAGACLLPVACTGPSRSTTWVWARPHSSTPRPPPARAF